MQSTFAYKCTTHVNCSNSSNLYNSTLCASEQELELANALDSNHQLQMHPNNNIGIEDHFHFHLALALLAQYNSSSPMLTSKRSLKVICISLTTYVYQYFPIVIQTWLI